MCNVRCAMCVSRKKWRIVNVAICRILCVCNIFFPFASRGVHHANATYLGIVCAIRAHIWQETLARNNTHLLRNYTHFVLLCTSVKVFAAAHLKIRRLLCKNCWVLVLHIRVRHRVWYIINIVHPFWVSATGCCCCCWWRFRDLCLCWW